MINKYQSDLTIDYNKVIPYYETVLPTEIPEESVPFYYTTHINERLDIISYKFYKTPNKWWIIAKANNLAEGTIAVSGGIKLFIPNI